MDFLPINHLKPESDLNSNPGTVTITNTSFSHDVDCGALLNTSAEDRRYNIMHCASQAVMNFDASLQREYTLRRSVPFSVNLSHNNFGHLIPGNVSHSRSLEYSSGSTGLSFSDFNNEFVQYEIQHVSDESPPQLPGFLSSNDYFNTISYMHSTIKDDIDQTCFPEDDTPDSQRETSYLFSHDYDMSVPNMNFKSYNTDKDGNFIMQSPRSTQANTYYEDSLKQNTNSFQTETPCDQVSLSKWLAMPPGSMEIEVSFDMSRQGVLKANKRKRGVPLRQRCSPTRWEEIRPYFTGMYAERDLRLKDIALRLANEHDFHAT